MSRHLQRDAVILDEAHPGVTPTAPKDILPVLYYPHEGYLVRNSNHVYGNNDRTTLVSTGSLGESSAPVFPLDLVGKSENQSEEWQEAQIGEWGEVSQLTTLYRFGSEPEPVVVKGRDVHGLSAGGDQDYPDERTRFSLYGMVHP